MPSFSDTLAAATMGSYRDDCARLALVTATALSCVEFTVGMADGSVSTAS